MFRRCKQKSFSAVTSERNRRLDLIFGTVFAFLFAIIVGSIIFSGVASAYDFSVTIPEGEVLEVKLFNSDGTTMGSATSMNVSPTSLSSPGFNEKDVVVSVGTSNEWGYNLVMNVSNTTLVSQEDNTNTISNLTTKSGGYTCTPETAATCDFTVNSWGFKIKTATNTQEATNYIPVPTTINLNTNNTTTNGDPVYLSFGSRINVSQEPGTYTTTINFIATAKPEPLAMQTVSSSKLAELMPNNGDTTILPDLRDNSDYELTNINGTYWMTQNLRITGTISASKSNFTGPDFNISAGDLTSGNSYTEARSHYDNNTTYGAYYNYCAASAGTVCSSENVTQATTSDICPKGWRMPTGYEMSVVLGNSSNWNNFNFVYGGMYLDGKLESNTESGHLYGSSLYYHSGIPWRIRIFSRADGTNTAMSATPANYGLPLRCVFNNNLNYMQDITSSKLAELMPSSGSSTRLYDKRDNSDYQITNINGTYWMTQNLRILGSVSASLSNFTGSDFNISAGDLTSGNSYTEARSHADFVYNDRINYGAYYNYCAASAGTICSESSTQVATSDICPKGWRLPNDSEMQVISNNKAANWDFVLAGVYADGSLSGFNTVGSWWGVTVYTPNGATWRTRLMKTSSIDWELKGLPKNYGIPIRCVFDL